MKFVKLSRARTHECMRSAREERAKEAIMCLKLSGHELSKGYILDLGCGSGFITNYLISRGMRTVGLDLSKKPLFKAKVNNPTVDLVLASGVKLPFRENIFYTIILNDVLEHVSYKDAEPMLKQIRNGLEPNGKLYISVANKYQIREPHTLLLFGTWLPRKIYNPVIKSYHSGIPVYPYTVGRLKQLCEKTGFSHENYTWFYARKKLLKLDYIKNRLARKIIALLKKIILMNNLLNKIVEQFSVILFVCARN